MRALRKQQNPSVSDFLKLRSGWQTGASDFLSSGRPPEKARKTIKNKRACESSAVRKYFVHSGAMMTADGSDDDLIKFEGVPKGQKFTF